MKFQLVSSSALSATADLAVIGVHTTASKDPLFRAANADLGGALAEQAKAEDFTGKSGQTLIAHTQGALPCRFIAFVGAGDKSGFAVAKIRDLAAKTVKLAKKVRAKNAVFSLPSGAGGRKFADGLYFGALGLELGAYKFSKYKNGDTRKAHKVTRFQLDWERAVPGKRQTAKAADKRVAKQALARAQIVARAVCKARDLVNEPAGHMTPSQMASEARALARKIPNLSVKILGRKDCEKLGMGMFLAVGRGSSEEPRLIHLSYKPKKKAKKRVALIGKGVTFDSGGYSLKPSAAMEDMKIDMSGAAAVIAAMGAVAELASPYEVHAVAACAENLVSGNAYKLGDVLEAMDGTTVEINNTDAEGRLTLGDALTYARTKIKPDEMFDFATLTGACMVALGPYTAGVMSDSEPLVKDWLAAAAAAGEDVWRLPLNPRLREQLKSNIADMRNTGERWGGALTAGLFLKHFAKDTPWVHVDIAGPASANRESGAVAKGGTGFGVATIVQYLT